MSIITKTRTVYFSSAANRTYLTKRAAVSAEAGKLIERKYPTEPYESDTGAGWHWKSDARLVRLHKRLVRRILRSLHQEKNNAE